VDTAYLTTYGIELLAGRNFHASDSVNRIIINETLAAKLEFASPEEAVGQPLQLGERSVTVIGVIKDFHSKSLREEVDKIVLAQNPEGYAVTSIKIKPSVNSEGMSQTLRQIEQVWSSIYPESVFDYQFFDESIEAYYQEERKFASLFQVFSVVFMLIGCLGLYGLISFVVHKKLKEVAVRKVFGAGIWDILVLISRDYLRLIFLAFVIAVPVAFYFMQRWLDNFAYHIEISWWILVMPGLAVVLVAMLAVSGQSMKAARANPAKILKDE
jgi:ABC-type antimicrobial peptide transport system permease subunit